MMIGRQSVLWHNFFKLFWKFLTPATLLVSGSLGKCQVWEFVLFGGVLFLRILSLLSSLVT